MSRKYENIETMPEVDFDYKKFGTTLKALIKARGFTQLRFAEYVGIEYSTLIAILAGKRRVYLHTYMKLITALNITDVVLISQTLPKENIREHIETFLKLIPVFSSLSPESADLFRKAQGFASNDDE